MALSSEESLTTGDTWDFNRSGDPISAENDSIPELRDYEPWHKRP